MSKVHQITPILHVPNLEKALHLLCETLTFEVKYRGPGSDVDQLYELFRSKLDILENGMVEPPRDKPWRQREFMVKLPDGDWIAIAGWESGHAARRPSLQFNSPDGRH